MNKENIYTPKKYPFAHNLSEKEYFILACFSLDIQHFYREWIEQGRKQGRFQFFDTDNKGLLVHKYWVPSNICCHTKQLLTQDTIEVKVGYWTPFLWKPVHKDYRQLAQKQEAYNCQIIDASCSDCYYLQRDTSWCKKMDKKVSVEPNLCHPQNQECFTHRKDIKT